ncbi:glycosyltransferase family 32 protein [uncultured Sphingomonas sp.]|uniref:glycosyltransferase family 32 protein n=1 Tax=uncultured Sphingomonas sp. TaxID=158754 RepID=UPI0035CAD11A
MMIGITEQPLGALIPKHLHQTFAVTDLPAPLRGNIDALRVQNPGWNHTLYTDVDIRAFIADEYGRGVLRLYDRIAEGYGAARADLFRYLLMYRLGGVYLDVKSSFRRPIDEVINGQEGYILSHWRNGPSEPHAGWGIHGALDQMPGGEFQQWHIIAAPGHPFLRAVIARVLDNIRRYSVRRNEVGWPGVLGLTGPIAYTLAIAPLVGRYPARILANETEIGLDYNVLGGSAHQRLFGGRHYTSLTHPVVRQPGPRGWLDRLHVEVRRRRKAWSGQS